MWVWGRSGVHQKVTPGARRYAERVGSIPGQASQRTDLGGSAPDPTFDPRHRERTRNLAAAAVRRRAERPSARRTIAGGLLNELVPILGAPYPRAKRPSGAIVARGEAVNPVLGRRLTPQRLARSEGERDARERASQRGAGSILVHEPQMNSNVAPPSVVRARKALSYTTVRAPVPGWMRAEFGQRSSTTNLIGCTACELRA